MSFLYLNSSSYFISETFVSFLNQKDCVTPSWKMCFLIPGYGYQGYRCFQQLPNTFSTGAKRG